MPEHEDDQDQSAAERLTMTRRRLRVIANPHFWVVVVLLTICIVLHYPQQILKTDSASVFTFMGLTRHATERILLLLPIVYAVFAFGTGAGLISLALATAIMLPRVFVISEYFPDSALETAGVVFIGGMVNLWFYGYRKEKRQRQQIISSLEYAYQELQNRTRTMEEDEKRLSTLNKISRTVSQSLELSQILDRAIDSVVETMRVDAAWIFLLSRDNSELLLAAHRGFPEGLPRIKVGSGLSGRVAESGKPLFLEDSSKDPALPDQVKQQMGSAIIVPLRAKGRINGTLGVSSLKLRSFQQGEIELLTATCDQIGVAIENARLYQRQQEVLDELRLSEQRYRDLIESAHDAIWMHDLNGNLVAVNKAAEELTGYTARELLTMNVRSFLAEDSITLAKRIRQMLAEGQAVEQPYEQHLVRRDGSQAILKLTSNIIKEDGTITGFMHVARDVTVEQEMQDKLSAAYRELSDSHERLKESQENLIQAEKLTSLGQLAASVAHEVNNPLSGVLTYTQLLMKKIAKNDISTEKSLEYLRKMEAEVTRSTKLIRNLLDFSRQSPPAFSEVNLNEVVNRSYDLAAHAAALQRVQVVKELDPALPVLKADFDQLQQVCTNLILNGVQAMTGGGTLTLRTWADGDQVMVQVRDTGCGISPENMHKLFTPFFTTKREVKGVGLGLAVSYGIIQRHKGRIEVQSKEGQGTTFTLVLPLHPIELDGTGQPSEKSNPSGEEIQSFIR